MQNRLKIRFIMPLSIMLLIMNALAKITSDIFKKEYDLIIADFPCLLLWLSVLTDYTRQWNVANCKIAHGKSIRVMMVQLLGFIIEAFYLSQRNDLILWLHQIQAVLLLGVVLCLTDQRRILFEWEDYSIEERYRYEKYSK